MMNAKFPKVVKKITPVTPVVGMISPAACSGQGKSGVHRTLV